MNRQEFLDDVKARLEGLSEEDITKALSFYEEAIDDRTEDGLSEEDAIKDIGTPEEIASEILLDTPITKLVKAKVNRKKQSIETWEIVMIILLFPIWVPVLISVIAVLFSIYVTLWSLVISLIATIVGLVIGGLAMIVMALTGLYTSGGLNTLGIIGMGVLGVGLGLALVIPVKWACIGLFKLMKAFVKWIKRIFIKK